MRQNTMNTDTSSMAELVAGFHAVTRPRKVFNLYVIEIREPTTVLDRRRIAVGGLVDVFRELERRYIRREWHKRVAVVTVALVVLLMAGARG